MVKIASEGRRALFSYDASTLWILLHAHTHTYTHARRKGVTIFFGSPGCQTTSSSLGLWSLVFGSALASTTR